MSGGADGNPYAPPAGDGSVHAFAGGGESTRGLRIAGGVVLIIVGLWSVAGGGCSIVAGQVIAEAAPFSSELSRLPGTEQAQQQARKALAELGGRSGALVAAGVVILVGGLLCAVAAALLLLDRGRRLGYVAVAIAAAGELLFFALIAFNVGGLIKLALCGFGGFCASHAGRNLQSYNR